jgi:hypothetical protein
MGQMLALPPGSDVCPILFAESASSAFLRLIVINEKVIRTSP